jgi:hypothetical protein
MNKLQIFVLIFVFGSLQTFSQNITAISQDVADVAIPEVLLSFDAIINDKKVELTWASNAEYNNTYFTIEKSKDAIAFETFLKIRSFGNNSNIINYFDVDYTPYEGISYYRLTQTDALGHTMSSRVVLVNNKGDNKNLVLANNSPKELIQLNKEAREALVVLRNERGEESFSKVTVDENNVVRISSDDATKLNNGTYVIIASSDNKLYSKIVKIQ